MADPLLTLAGRKWVTSGGGSFTGGAVVQLNSSGTWVELTSGGVVAWNLNEFTFSDASTVLFYIRSSDFITAAQRPNPGLLYRSVDLGTTWVDVTPSSGLSEFVNDIAQDADKNLWLITDEREDNGISTPNKPSRIYKSTNKGATWTLKYTSLIGASDRYPGMFNITCHPTDSNKIAVETAEVVGWRSRITRSADGGTTWEVITPTVPDPPLQPKNVSSVQQNVFNYTSTRAIIWSGSFETALDDFFVLRSIDDGTTWTLQYTEVLAGEHSTGFFEAGSTIYAASASSLFSATPAIGSVTKIASDGAAPFVAAHVMNGISRHVVSGVSTLLLGCRVGVAPAGESPVFTRPADLSSDWVTHPQASSMDANLGYTLYVARLGLIGASPPPTAEPLRPPQEQGPPAAPSGGDPGAAFPPTGIGRMRRERLARKQQREQRTQQAQVLRRIPSQARGDQIDKSAPPRGTAPVEPRKWLVFGWTTPAVVNSQKTLTLRAMGPVEAVQWRMGELVYAYDRDPSDGGERLALLRLTHDPYEVSTMQLRKSDFNALGFGYLQAMGITAPNGNTPTQIWQRMQQTPERLYVVRFRIERLYDARAPTRGIISV